MLPLMADLQCDKWNVISNAAHTAEIGKVIDDAMRAIEQKNTALKNVSPKNYGSPDLDKRVLGEGDIREKIIEDEEALDQTYVISKNQISVKSLDLNQDFEAIRKGLDAIAKKIIK